MSKKPKTHALLVVDRSGSMDPIADDVRGGFNTYIDSLRHDAGRYRITATMFDTTVTSLCVAAKLRDVPGLMRHNYTPRGTTALLDAIGKTITEFESATTLATGERVIVVVYTDGKENASTKFTTADISRLIADREATGQWEFIYLGAGPEACGLGPDMGFHSSVHTAATSRATRTTFHGLSAATSSFASGADPDATVDHLKTTVEGGPQ